jgi:molybdopterin-containing oxidoreductase family membrane subunit
MGVRRFRTITGCVLASVCVIAGMWLERFLIIVPSLGHKYLPYSFGIYRPQPVEIIIAGATFAGDGAPVRAVRQVRPDHFDLGAEGGRSPAAEPDSAGH